MRKSSSLRTMTQHQAVDAAYIFASSNRFSHIADIYGSYVAYGSSNLLALWDAAVRTQNHLFWVQATLISLTSYFQDPNDRGTHATRTGHEGVITAVRFVSESSLVTGDDTGTLALWSKADGIVGVSCDMF